MRLRWLWFNRLSTYIGLAFMLAEACAWTWCSIHAGHAVGFRRFHQQFEQALFQLVDRADDAQVGSAKGRRRE